MELGSSNFASQLPDNDQFFLLYFILGTYFGPDLEGKNVQKSVLQRIAEGSPTYTSQELTGSSIKAEEVERVYYYVLRKADPCLAVKLPVLRRFFYGTLPKDEKDHTPIYPQFPDFFPTNLHPHSRIKNRYRIIENIAFIDNPDTSYIKPENTERFKRLTGLENLVLDGNAARFFVYVDGSGSQSVAAQGAEHVAELSRIRPYQSFRKTKRAARMLRSEDQHVHDATPLCRRLRSGAPVMQSSLPPLQTQVDNKIKEKADPAMIFVPSCPNKDWISIHAASKRGFALTGSAAMGQVGPIVGLMDIGECDDAYMFRVSLPGVKRDESEFSCEVENDGRVQIKGVTTTGERTVHRFSQKFEMLSANLCPPGQFSISFQLPGPVDSKQFLGNFGMDGILEAMVMKARLTSR